MVKRLRPDVSVVPLRGNVGTRIRKLEAGEVDATLLALAGLKRLGLADKATALLGADEFLPAVGQGAITIEARVDDARTHELLAKIDHADTSVALACERAFLAVLDGSCRTPIAGLAELDGNRLTLEGLLLKPNGSAADMNRIFASLVLIIALGPVCSRAADYPSAAEADYTIRDFKFSSGETLPELRIHYRTIGKIDKDNFADLVILKSNPVDDISRASDIDSVIKNGVVYSVKDLLPTAH